MNTLNTRTVNFGVFSGVFRGDPPLVRNRPHLPEQGTLPLLEKGGTFNTEQEQHRRCAKVVV